MALEVKIFSGNDTDAAASKNSSEHAVEMINGDGSIAEPEQHFSEIEYEDADEDGPIADTESEAEKNESEEKQVEEVQTEEDHPGEVTAADRADAERIFELEVTEAKNEHCEAAIRRTEAETEFKQARADEKAALKALRALLRRGPAYPEQNRIQQAAKEGGQRSAIVVDDPSADDSWKAIPTLQVLQGIKGMGDKKAEAIYELAPTLGDLEELRAQAGLLHKPFASVLPRGIGGNLSDEIENKIIDAVTKHTMHRQTANSEAEIQVEEQESVTQSEAAADLPSEENEENDVDGDAELASKDELLSDV